MTISFKGSNPALKDDLLALLCDSFENRIMNSSNHSDDTDESN